MSVVLLISEVDEVVKKKKNTVWDISEAKVCVIVIFECNYDFTKNMSYHYIVEVSSWRTEWSASLIDVCSSFSRSSHTFSPFLLKKKKKIIKRKRESKLYTSMCHKTQLLLLLTHFSCHRTHCCCSFVWMWKELWFVCKPSYTMNNPVLFLVVVVAVVLFFLIMYIESQ